MAEYRKGVAWSQNFLSSLAYLTWGYAIGVSNSVLEYLEKVIFPGISDSKLSFIASILTIGATVGAMIGSKLSIKYGRRKVLLIGDIIFLIGAILTLIESYGAIVTGRLIEGFIIGINSSVALVYAIEMTPKSIRGAALNVNFVCLPIGVTLAYVLGFLMPQDVDSNSPTNNTWRFCFIFVVIFPIIRILLFVLKDKGETPFWLFFKRRDQEGRAVLNRLYIKQTEEIEKEIKKDIETVFYSKEGQVKVADLFKPKYRKMFLVCLMVNVVHQLSGTSTIFVFAKKIFEEGLDKSDNLPNIMSTLVGSLNLIFTIVSIFVISKFGRKNPFVLGVFLMGVCELCYSLISYASSQSSLAAKIMILLYPTVFSWSSGGVSFLYIGEVLPDVGVSLIILINWICNFLSTQFFLDIANSLTFKGIFLIFAIYNFLTALFSGIFMKESKNKSKAEMYELYYPTKKISKVKSSSSTAMTQNQDMPKQTTRGDNERIDTCTNMMTNPSIQNLETVIQTERPTHPKIEQKIVT